MEVSQVSGSAAVTVVKPVEPSRKRDEWELYGARPGCVHETVSAPGGGVRCTKCPGWFCF